LTPAHAKARSTPTTRLIFVPAIGFRPVGTRTLRERAETTANGTELAVLAVAAAPDRTDVVIEWELTGDPATCPPDSQLLTYSNSAPLGHGLTVTLAAGTRRLDALTMRRRAFHSSYVSIGAIDALTFPALPDDADAAELRVSESAREWRVPFGIALGEVNAAVLGAEVERDGVVVRATAVSHSEDELIVELEVEAPHQIRQVAAPVPTSARFSNTSEEDQRARRAEMHRVFGDRSSPITLEADRGARSAEERRPVSQEPQQAAPGRPFKSRFLVMFDAPSTAAKSATLVVPFVELNDFGSSVTADLRAAPLDLELGEHRFRVLGAEPSGGDQRRVALERKPSSASPRFMQPARMYGSQPDKFAWLPDAGPGETFSMTTAVGDPPIVTFTGTVLRVDGPLRLAIPLG
jgi:hypothetical protein